MSLDFSEIENLWTKISPSVELSQCVYVDIDTQTLFFFKDKELVVNYSISTAKNGLGNQQNSYKTPRGFHQVIEKIGANQPLNMMFNARQATAELAKIDQPHYTEQDTITSRILWLSGLEEGVNLSGNVDTKSRYIYIHGTADEAHLGQPLSHGCVRMKNTDIIELFDMVEENTIVLLN